MPALTVIESRTPVTPSADPSWNESHAVYWFDRDQGVAGLHRLAHQPHRGTAHAWHCVMGPHGSFRRMSTTIPFEPAMRAGEGYVSEHLTFSYHERGGVDITAAYAEGRAELVFDDHQPALETFLFLRGQRPEDLTTLPDKLHFEAGGTVTGEVELGGQRFRIDALGYRDHSWGPRHMAGLQATNWLVGTTGPDLTVGVSGFVTRDGMHGTRGFVVDGGESALLVDPEITYTMGYDGLSVNGATVEAVSQGGRTYSMRFHDPMKAPVTAIDSWMATETLCHLTVDGRDGVGLCERTFSTCGGTVAPAWASNGLLHEGFLPAAG